MGVGEDKPRRFCLATLEKLTEYFPGGSYIVLKSTPRVTGRDRMHYIASAIYCNEHCTPYCYELKVFAISIAMSSSIVISISMSSSIVRSIVMSSSIANVTLGVHK